MSRVVRNRLSNPSRRIPGCDSRDGWGAGGEPFRRGHGGGEGGDLIGVGGGEARKDVAQVGAHVDSHAFAAFHDADDGGD